MEYTNSRSALDSLTSAHLPLVYNVVGLALNGHPDRAGVVRETMTAAVPDPRADPRTEAAFRRRLLATCVSRVREASQGTRPRPAAGGTADSDFVQLAVRRLRLAGEQRELLEASRWLGDEDRLMLALWWQEARGALHRDELATALELFPDAAVEAVTRLARQLDASRAVERALRRDPACPGLMAAAGGRDGPADPAARDRLAQHVLGCRACAPRPGEVSPAKRLLADLPLAPPPPGLGEELPRPVPLADHGRPAEPSRKPPRPAVPARRPAASGRARRRLPTRPTLVIISAAVALCLVGGIVTAVRGSGTRAASGLTIGDGTPLVTTGPSAPPSLAGEGGAASGPATGSASSPGAKASANTPPPPDSFSLAAQKGVGASAGDGVSTALAVSGTSWYYDWEPSPSGIVTPPGVTFVPMIKDASDVSTTVLNEVRQEGRYLLGFNEPDRQNLTVDHALALWPQLEATGMLLGSPAIAYGTNRKTSWLGQFMLGAQAHGYRVDFVAAHWYGQHNWDNIAANVAELKRYLTQTYALWGKPIWLTEFSLIDFQDGPTPQYPTAAQQAAFLTAATTMLSTLHFVHRYAWYALSASGTSKGTAALYDKTAAATASAAAFKNAP
jgi:hypothetical protein